MTEFTDLQGLAKGQVWQHKNNDLYVIDKFTNLEAARQDEYPTTVCYDNLETGAPYSRALARWAGNFVRREALEKGPQSEYIVQVTFYDGNHVLTEAAKVTAESHVEALKQVRTMFSNIRYINVISTTPVAQLKQV